MQKSKSGGHTRQHVIATRLQCLMKDAFVTKEYLSKALLEYMLHLELLPQINDVEDGKK